jgi:hypothetical protein
MKHKRGQCPCGRPIHAKGLCRACYRKDRKSVQRRRSQSSLVPGARPPKIDPPDQGLCTGFSDLTQTERAVWENGMLRRGDEYQMPGIMCPDCRGEIIATEAGYPVRSKPDLAWCVSDRHPLFDATGRLVQMTPRASGWNEAQR